VNAYTHASVEDLYLLKQDNANKLLVGLVDAAEELVKAVKNLPKKK
jgi:hypothetical protein